MLRWSGVLLMILATSASAREVIVGSKVFTESVILAELATQLLDARGIETVHRRELGGTSVLWSGMLRGDIDCYPEYTGTLRGEVLASKSLQSDAQLREALAQMGVWASGSLGFDNTYVLGMRKDVAQRLSIVRMSDLAQHPELRFGFSNEFMRRADGWPGVKQAYGLPQSDVRGMQHDLAYRALVSGAIDVTDLYATDAEIAHYDLFALPDDRRFFPNYDAIFVCRSSVAEDVKQVLQSLENAIDAQTMAGLNAQAKLDRLDERYVAQRFAVERFDVTTSAGLDTRMSRIWQRTREHLGMVAVSLVAAIVRLPQSQRRSRCICDCRCFADRACARVARLPDPMARHRLRTGHRCAVLVQSVADSQEHSRGLGGHR
jgi:osmoprotectant transport system permease protein